MNARILEFLLILGEPRSFFGWAWRVIFWNFVIIGLDILVNHLLGNDVATSSMPAYFATVFLVSTPLLSLTFIAFRHVRDLQRELAELASTDVLTGLANRRAFMQRLEDTSSGTLLMVDVDHFKGINDRHGHSVGDAVLVEVAEHLKANVRSHDLVARLGGEEFGILLERTGQEEVRRIGERLADGIAMNAPDVSVTVSVGAAERRNGTGSDETLRRADAALYAAKRAGRGRLIVWSPKMDQAA